MIGQKRPPARILHAPPVKGAREPMCRTDEACISRMLSPGQYAGMVERLQNPALAMHDMEMAFTIALARDPADGAYRVSPKDQENFILRFLALRLARCIYPENFVNLHELRISRSDAGALVAAMYSDFVPDEGGVMMRRVGYSRRFYSASDDTEMNAIRLKSDAAEHASNPALAGCMRAMALSGISVPHPEANYHVSGGKTVFFEVLGLNLRKAFIAACEFSPVMDDSLALLSMICASVYAHYNRMNVKNASALARHFGPLGFEETSRIVFGILSASAQESPSARLADRLGLFDELHSSMQTVYALADSRSRISELGDSLKAWPVIIDHELI